MKTRNMIMDSETKKKIKDWTFWTVVIIIICGILWVYTNNNKIASAALEKRKSIICPSLLSIGRSARDTLIIMKNEELCNQFVLNNLK